MKPFDLDKAKSGHPLITRDGRKAKFIAHVPECDNRYKVLGYVDGFALIDSYTEQGTVLYNEPHSRDLFLTAEKKTGWVNIYPPAVYSSEYRTMGLIFPSKEQADNSTRADRLACIQISWEE